MLASLRTVLRASTNGINAQRSSTLQKSLLKTDLQSSKISTSLRQFSTEVAPPVIEVIHPETTHFVSRAIREEAKGTYKNLSVSPRKLGLVCRMVRGLSIREALIQLRLTHWKKAVYVRRAIRTIASYATGNFNMTRSRLYIKEINCTKGVYYKRYDFKGRSRIGIRSRMHAHVTITLAEQPYRRGEIRIGRYGRTIKSWQRTDSLARAFHKRKAEV